MRVAPGLVLLAACLAAPPGGRAQEPTKDDLLRAVQAKLREVVPAAGPAVVTVVASKSEHYPKPPADAPWKLGGFDRKEFAGDNPSEERAKLAHFLDLSGPRAIEDHGYAGGVVVDAAGLVLTPYHVVDGATKVYVHLTDKTGSYADVHAADARSDLAVLKLLTPPADLKAVKFAAVRTADAPGRRATVFPGKLCVLLTRPYSAALGLGKEPAAAFGSVTGVRYAPPRPFPHRTPLRHPEYGTFLEYDVRPHAGVTGGVLLDLSGEMIGLTNAAAVAWGAEFGPGYAVPADEYFRGVVRVLARGEEVEYGFLGVASVAPGDQNSTVVNPNRDGPAWQAGMRPGDRIVRVNDHPVASFNDLLLHVGSALAGSTVKVAVPRGLETVELDVTLAKFRHDQPHLASVRPDPVFGLRVDYGSILAQQLNAAVGPGVCVREVAADSPAAKHFKALGDDPKRWLVTHVNGAPVGTPAEFYKAAKGREKVKLSLQDPTDRRDREVTLP